MKRTISLFVILALPAVLLVGCGGDDSADTTTTTKSDQSSSDSGKSDDGGSSDSADPSDAGSSGGSAIDEFCDETAAIAAELKDAIADRDQDKLKELQERANKLQEKTSELTQEMMSDPSQLPRLTDCAKQVADAAQG